MDVGDWLRKLGLERYDSAFRENRIDGEILPKLTAEDLKELGVEAVGDRRRLLEGIAALATANATAPSPRPAAPASDAERRLLTVMFTDLVGSTALSARLDPEDLREIIGAYLRCCAQVIAQFGGFVAKYMGDGVLAYFGYPTANEDDAERAVTAGLALVETLASRPAPGAIRLPVRIGIATGMVVVGELIGSGKAQERGVVGETPNLAARLQALAAPGQVVIAPSTRRLTGGHFEYQELGPRPLKGFAEPVSPWVVLGVSAVASRFEARHESTLTPLVGREEEFDLLLRRWRQASEGEGWVVQLIGEPGIGKSRLTTALQERLRPEPHVELRYFCSPHHTDSALFPFIGQLERAARFERGEGPAEKLAKLDAMAALSDVDAAEVVPLLAELLSLPLEGRTFPEMTPQQRKDKTLAALLALLEGLARKQPVLAIFEDVHWIDPTSLELLALSVERAPQRRVMFLITARPEFAAPWPGLSHVTTLALTRLSRSESATLVARVAGGKALPEEVMAQILARTDGVPLFVEELTKTVLESGMLREAAGTYVLDAPLPGMAIPITLHASLMARLDRLASVKEVTQIGAAIGRDFSYELLDAVAQIERENLAVALDRLVRAELVFCRGAPPHSVYTFKHALVRDAAYASLLRAPRQQLHARIAAALEARFPEITEAQPELLAQHFGEGGFEEKALNYWTLAGERAAERGANTEAIRHFRRALELIERKSASRESAEAELRVVARLGPAVANVEGLGRAGAGDDLWACAPTRRRTSPSRRCGVGAGGPVALSLHAQ